jgi:predicted PurR-regulated permease PerM
MPLMPGRSRDDILRIVGKIDRAISAFFRGRVIVCTICGLVTWLGLWIIGIKYSFLFGFLIGVSTVIPNLGLVFLAPTLLVAWFGQDGSIWAVVWTTVLYFGVQTLQGAILDPIILGREVEIHPVFLILAFLICGKLLGFIGILLAVPIASVIKILMQEFVLPSVEEIAAEEPTGLFPKESEAGESGDTGDSPEDGNSPEQD